MTRYDFIFNDYLRERTEGNPAGKRSEKGVTMSLFPILNAQQTGNRQRRSR